MGRVSLYFATNANNLENLICRECLTRFYRLLTWRTYTFNTIFSRRLPKASLATVVPCPLPICCSPSGTFSSLQMALSGEKNCGDVRNVDIRVLLTKGSILKEARCTLTDQEKTTRNVKCDPIVPIQQHVLKTRDASTTIRALEILIIGKAFVPLTALHQAFEREYRSL